jgi:hypothetical protein
MQLPRYETLNADAGEQDEKRLIDHATAFITKDESVAANLVSVSKPVVIPRMGKGATAPLLRAWPPELAALAISKQDFITFIDNLNILSQPPAHAVALRIAAIGIAFIPFDGADGVAIATELAADALARYTVRTRCHEFLKRTNQDLFHPRGLHARLLNSNAMRQATNIPEDDPLIVPLAEDTLNMSPHKRCLEHMKQYSCELSEDVPEPVPQTKVLQRVAAWHVRYQNRCFAKAAIKARKREWKKFAKGKRLKREGDMEKKRIKKLQWLVVQDLSEFEEEGKGEPRGASRLGRLFGQGGRM